MRIVENSSARLKSLDALRGIAATAVLLRHYTSDYSERFGISLDYVPDLWFGYFGVEIFFVISGFVILWTVQRQSMRDFAIGRATRLYPVYWAAVCLTTLVVALDSLVTVARPTVLQFAGNLTMVQRLLAIEDIDLTYWTLTYELIFYVVIACAWTASEKFKIRIEWLLLFWLAFAICVRASGLYIPYRATILGLLYYGQFFIIGMGLFLNMHGRADRLTYVCIALAVLLLFFGAGPSTPPAGLKSYPVFAFLACAIVFLALKFDPAWLRNRVLLFLGAISYPLYLVHAVIGYVVMNNVMAMGFPAFVAVLAAIMVAVMLATLLHVTLERRLVPALRKRFVTRRTERPAVA